MRQRLADALDPPDLDPTSPPPVVVVTGPAGAGKTTFLSGWAAGLDATGDPTAAPRTVAWVTVDPGDGVDDLWSAILAAVEGTGALPDPSRLHGLVVPRDTAEGGFVAHVAQVLADADRPLWLVVDEVENLTDDAAVRSLDLLIRWVPWPVRLVLAGRADPPVALHRLRLDGRLLEIRARDLALTREESGLLLDGHGICLPDDDLDLLHRRTEGWAAGLRLAAMSLEGAADPRAFLVRFAGDERAVADYLVGEIYARQTEDIRGFLLDTSVCEELTPALAAALTGREDSGAVLDRLVRRNALTVQLGEANGWYRYHALLRGYLSAELQRTSTSRRRDLHRRAAAWFETQGHELRAIEHAVAGQDETVTARLLEQRGLRIVMSGGTAALARSIAAAPRAAFERPAVRLVAAATALDRGDVAAADEWLDGTVPDALDAPGRALHATLRLLRARLLGDCSAELSALQDTVAGRSGDRDLDLLALAERGTAHLWLQELDDAERDLSAAVTMARADGRDHVALHCLSSLAAVGSSGSDILLAGDRAEAAIAFAGERGWARTSECAYAHVLAGLAAYQRIDDDAARSSAQIAVELVGGAADPTVRFSALALHVRLVFDVSPEPHEVAVGVGRAWQELGSTYLSPALVAYAAVPHHRMCLRVGEVGWAREITRCTDDRLGQVGEVALLTALLHVHSGRAGAARTELVPVLSEELPCVVVTTLIEAWLLEAVLAELGEDRARAHAAVTTALRLAGPRGMVRPFVEVGRPVRALLATGLGRFGYEEAFATRVLAVIPPDSPGPVDLLSEREHEVLAELPSLRTASEIAEGLFVSTNTVKSHLRNIYRKLGAQTRREAIVAARQRGLL
jgi:LuxR family maltose regulon positive regulatory protein